MKKTITTLIWATPTCYLLLTWVGGEYYFVQRYSQHCCKDDTLISSEYLSKSQIRDLLTESRDKYSLRTFAPATEWLGYALNKGINPEQAQARLLEGGVL